MFPVSWEPRRVVCAWGRVCFSLCARKPSSLALMAFCSRVCPGCSYCGLCWHLLQASARPPPTPFPHPANRSSWASCCCARALLLLPFLSVFFLLHFYPVFFSCSPSTGCCLSLLRHQFLVLLGAESQALPCDLSTGRTWEEHQLPEEPWRGLWLRLWEPPGRPGEFAADSRHYAC